MAVEAAPGLARPHIVALRWPAEADEAERLAAQGIPRLLLVEPGVEPPTGPDGLEVWLRLPADGGQFERQLAILAERAVTREDTVHVDGFGRLFVGHRWIPLSETQMRVVAVLVAEFGEVVTEDRLLTAGWPERPSSAANLRVLIFRLRPRLLDVGLELRTVRGRGLVLERRT